MRITFTALLVTNSIQVTNAFYGAREVTTVAFAGGFGASSSTKKGKKSKKKKKKGSLLSDIDAGVTTSTSTSTSTVGKSNNEDNGPELDRFGLPILTAENFFPPLPQGTELIGLGYGDEDNDTSLEDVKSCMEGYIPLDYDIFDENSMEKKTTTKNDDDAFSTPWKMNLLHKSPPVLEIENFFSEEECLQYMNIANGVGVGDGDDDDVSDVSKEDLDTTDAALKVDSATFSSHAVSKRTSTTWYCHFSQVPTLLAKAKRLLNDLPLKQMEEAQIVRYRTGEEFSWHYDEIPIAQLSNGGQRIATLLVYLNTIEKGGGGGTIFRDLKDSKGNELTMQPKQGSALLFFPALLNGQPDDRTLHKGEVAVDEKMIAQMWIHEKDYSPVIPEGNSHEAAIEVIQAKEIELGYKSD